MATTIPITKNVVNGTVTLYMKVDVLPVKVGDTVSYSGITGRVTATGPRPGPKNWYVTITFP